MQKKNVLGTDPFKWLKENKNKEISEKPKSGVDSREGQKASSLDPVNMRDTVETRRDREKQEKGKVYDALDDSETHQRQGVKLHGSGNVKEPYKLQEEKNFEPSDISEENRKAVLGKDAYKNHTNSHQTTHKDSPATAFVIVYTVLLLILGFIIYRDLTKQIDRLEMKLEKVEKQLDADLMKYQDKKLDSIW